MSGVDHPPPEAAVARTRRSYLRLVGVLLAVVAIFVVVALVVGREEEITTDECGKAPRKADGGTWRCTFVDEFDGRALDREKWMVPHGPPTGAEGTATCPFDDPRNVAVVDGELRLTVTPIDAPLVCQGGLSADHAGGTVATYHLFSQQYGRFEARMRSADVREPGLHDAFWLWPDDRYPDPRGVGWPAAGEIDVAEMYSQYPDLAIPFFHYGEDDNGGPDLGNNTAHCGAKRGEWHTYVLEWTADELRVEVDGDTCLVNDSGDPAFDKRYIIMLTAGLGRAGNAYTGAFDLPQTLSVDYVRVWE